MNNKLSESDIDSSLTNKDERKPIRKAIDNIAIPVAGIGLSAATSTLGALKKIKRETKLYDI